MYVALLPNLCLQDLVLHTMLHAYASP